VKANPQWSRRNFLSTRGLASSAGGVLGALLGDSRATGNLQPQIGPGHCCVARRAMACEFSIYLPADTPRPIEAGQAALDEIEILEDLLTVYRSDSAMSYVNQNAADRPITVDAHRRRPPL
jgi:thiamine biosynthesis lipoprotein